MTVPAVRANSACSLLLALTLPLGAQTPAAPTAESLLATLQRTIARNDRQAVSRLFAYPVDVVAGGLQIPVRDAAALIEMYDLIFTPEVRCQIEETGNTAKYRLQTTSEGASLGGGAALAVSTEAGWRIARMVVTGAPAPQPVPPRRVRFGVRPAQFAGTLERDDRESYLASVRAGARLDVRIDRFPGNDLELRVVDAASGRTLEGLRGPRAWAGTTEAAREYRIDVIRRAGYCAPATSYLLTVTMS